MLENCGEQLEETCQDRTKFLSCSDCSTIFVENGGCEMELLGLSQFEMVPNMMRVLPKNCMMQMEECRPQLALSCLPSSRRPNLWTAQGGSSKKSSKRRKNKK